MCRFRVVCVHRRGGYVLGFEKMCAEGGGLKFGWGEMLCPDGKVHP